MGESRAVRTPVRANVGGSTPPPPPDLARLAELGPEFFKTVEHLRGLQFGGVTSLLEDVGEAALKGAGTVLRQPGFKQVGQALEFEQRVIGKPIAKTVIGRPLQGLRALGVPVPQQLEAGAVAVGSALFTPSNVAFFLIPFGRAFQAGRLVGGQAAGAATGRITAAQAAQTSRLGLRQLFAPSTRQTARIMVAKRLEQDPQVVIRRAIKEPKISAEIDFVENQLKIFRTTMSPRLWRKQTQRLQKADAGIFNISIELLFGKLPPNATQSQRLAFFRNEDWLVQFFLDDGIDAGRALDHTGLFGKTWNGLKALPGMGPALTGVETGVTRVTRPVMLVNDVLRRPWLSTSAVVPGLNQEATGRAAWILTGVGRKFGEKAVLGEKVGLRYIGPGTKERAASAIRRNGWDDVDVDSAAKLIDDELNRMGDIVRNPDFYEMSATQRETLRQVRFIEDSDFDAAIARGVGGKAINENYFPQRASVEAMGVPEAARVANTISDITKTPKYAAALRHRKYDWDSFIIRAGDFAKAAEGAGITLTGSGVERNLATLLNWRFGATAKKTAEQLFYQRLAQNPATRSLVRRRRIIFRGKEISEEIASELSPTDFAKVKDDLVELFPLTGRKKVAETRTLRDLSLVPPSDKSLIGKFTSDGRPLRELAREADDLMRGQMRGEGTESIVSKGLDFMRSILLSADISPIGMVQGVRNFSADPAAYFAQIGEAAAWMTTKHGKRVWAIQNLPNIRYWTHRGLTLGNVQDLRPEMLTRLSAPVLGKKHPLFAMGWMNKQMMDMVQVAKLKNANTMLGAFAIAQRNGEVAGLLAGLPWFAQARRKLGPKWTQAQYDEVAEALADGLNNAIGPINFNLVNQKGVSETFERFLILTPSWTRGNIGQIVNLSKSGPKGTVARWLLMNQLGTGALLSTKISLAMTGEMPNFDPRASDFLSARLPWGRFNVLPAMPIYRLPARLIVGRDDFGDIEQRQTEFFKFVEGRMGQVPRITFDLMQGHDFLGRKIGNSAFFVGKELLPILGQEMVESLKEGGVSEAELAQRLALEFTGAAVIPKTPFQLERERVEELEGIPFEEVAKAKLRRLRKSDAVLRELRERQRAYRAERGGPLNQFFNILEERTEKLPTTMDEFIRAKPPDTPGFMAAFQDISAEELQARAVAAEAAKEALGIEEGDITDAPERILRDALAIEYWTVRPALEECRVSDDPEGCEDEKWTEFRELRQAVLDKAPSDEIRRYIVEEFSATRYAGNATAEEFERRRVLAQIASSDFFDASPYILPTGEEVPDALLQEIFKVRREANALINQLGISVFNQTGGQVDTLPDGTRRKLLGFLLQGATTPLRRTALAFQMLLESKAKDLLRNPRRDAILLENPDMIKFRPDVFGRFIRRREILANFADDPEIQRIAAGGG